jgi:IclR family KDG regulon transcriptional repressor
MKVLNNTFKVLDIFLVNRSEISLDELTKLSKLNKTTLSRIVRELVKYGFLMQRENRGKYSLGYKYFDFTGHMKIQMKTRDIAVPYLVKLSQQVNESIILALWTKGRAAVTETFQTKYTLKVIPNEGSRLSLNTTSCGKAILANLSTNEFNEMYKDQELERWTPNSITNFQDLKRHLTIIRREGVAFDDEENTPGVRSLAAVLKNFEGNVVGSVGVIGPSVRLTRARMIELVTPVRNCAEEISKALGSPRS